ncbi:MAG: hypothetical protein SWH54_10910 [Thermodesulfobacteriota bacterium]|nr:hypothetical protein [Thermodesulfobacteriota bacterium]
MVPQPGRPATRNLSVSGKVEDGMLILKGICTNCGNPVARVIENE